MKQIVTSIVVTGVLLNVLFHATDFLTKIIVLPFFVFAVSIGLKNAFIILKKYTWAMKVSKIYVVAFLIYWFGFLIYWDYYSFIDGKYMQIIYSIPLWFGGIYLTYNRLFKKN